MRITTSSSRTLLSIQDLQREGLGAITSRDSGSIYDHSERSRSQRMLAPDSR